MTGHVLGGVPVQDLRLALAQAAGMLAETRMPVAVRGGFPGGPPPTPPGGFPPPSGGGGGLPEPLVTAVTAPLAYPRALGTLSHSE